MVSQNVETHWKGREGPFPLLLGPGVFSPTTTSRTLADALEITPGDTVIDVGCGSGVLSIVAAKLGAARVYGVDLSQRAVEAAKEYIRAGDIYQVVPSQRWSADAPVDAFSIYLTLAVVFIAQATNTPLSFGDLLLVLGVSLITSKGAHGVPGSAIVILAATLNAVPSIPAIGLVLVLSVDWFIGMARALGNLIGNCVATVVVAAWEGDLDRTKARRVLDGQEVVDVTAG